VRTPFAPTVLVGLAAAGGTTVAAGRAWVVEEGAPEWRAEVYRVSATLPLAQALALVVLACWGVLLVARGRTRRVVALLGAVASLGTLLTVAAGAFLVPGDVAQTLVEQGLVPAGEAAARDRLTLTLWWWTALLGGLVALAASLLAVVSVGSWPEMGRRYDAPGARAGGREDDPGDLWRALDEGRDPTDRDTS
jgi:uncharacterized membrane protein (TIGR02234 family)